jgi:hypothetical protein
VTRSLSLATATAALLLAGCATGASPSAASSASPGAPTTGGSADAEAYCADQGGAIVDRVAVSNTNADPSAQLALAGRLRLCEFETGSGDQTTRISVDLTTLYSEEPTLAAVAYLSKIRPRQPPTVGQNPAEYHCLDTLGASSAFGNTNIAGGWVDAEQPIFVVMNLCVFADMSAIDEFGIWYYAAGTVRGADLAPIMRYQPGDQLPAMFERPRP